MGILLLTGCDNNEKEHDFVGIFTTANGIKFELRPDSTSIITFKDSMIYESSWKISKDRNNETYANIEFAGYQNYYYLKNGKLYRSIREMNHDALGDDSFRISANERGKYIISPEKEDAEFQKIYRFTN